MLTRDQAELIARATGRKPLTSEQFIDRILASQGFTRSQRRKLIASLKASAKRDPETEKDRRYDDARMQLCKPLASARHPGGLPEAFRKVRRNISTVCGSRWRVFNSDTMAVLNWLSPR
jgi:hypothetical protein